MEIRELQIELYKILLAVDQFCRDHSIQYSLYGGTLLGAVRHQGFIPWDDDIDICMTRDNYEKFEKCWQESPIEGLFLQTADTDPEWRQPFSKIRKENTAFIEYEYQKKLTHTGIFVDVMILDRMFDQGFLLVINWIEWVLFFIFTKGLPIKKAYKKTERVRLFKFTAKKYKKWMKKRLLHRCIKKSIPFVEANGLNVISKRYSCKLFDSYIEVMFEDRKFPIMANYDLYLNRAFGNYMELPPVEQQTWKHHPLIIDFQHSYAEIQSRKNK